RARAEEADTRIATSLATAHRGTDSGPGRTVQREAAPETIAAPEATRPAWQDAPTMTEDGATTVSDDATRTDPDQTRPG
ncbi:MAG: hypothetical protein ACRDIY_17420, partial [Chloroflexota bacterium]